MQTSTFFFLSSFNKYEAAQHNNFSVGQSEIVLPTHSSEYNKKALITGESFGQTLILQRKTQVKYNVASRPVATTNKY